VTYECGGKRVRQANKYSDGCYQAVSAAEVEVVGDE